MSRLLVVEDDATMRSALVQTLKNAGYEVDSAENGAAALEKALHQNFDLIVSDIRMPGIDGVTAVSRVKAHAPRIKTILITGYSDDEPIIRALNLGVDGILKKPFALREFLRMVSLKLEEKEKEDLHESREEKYHSLLSAITQDLDEERLRTLVGGDLSVLRPADATQRQKLELLIELARMAEMRQEYEVAIEALEQGLAALGDEAPKAQEYFIRLSLSNLFNRKGERELALFHGQEALSLARALNEPAYLIDAHHHVGMIFLAQDRCASLKHFEEAKRHLHGTCFTERRAISSLLFSNVWLGNGEKNKAREAMADFYSLGKRHFLPQVLVALQDYGLIPFLFSLDEAVNEELALWVLEEAAPSLQEKLRDLLKIRPSLSKFIVPVLSGTSNGKRPILELFGFGKLVIFVEGNSLLDTQWRSHKACSLLLYLAHEFPKLISEEHLLDLFWPSLDTEKGRHAFRTTLYFLRRTMGTELSRTLLHTDKQKFGIRPETNFTCDFLQFLENYREAKASLGRGESDRAALSFKETEKLYKGEFLQGWSEEWVLTAREQLKEAYTWTLMALASYHRKQRSWREALAYSQKAAKIDPTLEEAHSTSMECFLEMGKRDEAVRQFHACKDILKSELKLPPSESLRRLYFRAIDARPVAGAVS